MGQLFYMKNDHNHKDTQRKSAKKGCFIDDFSTQETDYLLDQISTNKTIDQ